MGVAAAVGDIYHGIYHDLKGRLLKLLLPAASTGYSVFLRVFTTFVLPAAGDGGRQIPSGGPSRGTLEHRFAPTDHSFGVK